MRLRINQPRDESLEDFLLCPTTENLGDFLKPILVDGKNHQLHRPVTIELHQNIIYTLQADKENLVQQVTQQWAVAPYLGACGVVSVSEYCGPSLTSVFSQLAWKQRSSLAVQLLTFAFNATFDNKAFAFYFTDLTPDNFAVSDSNEIRLVDLDNVIVVDKNPSEKPSNWDSVHTSYHDQDIHGFAFSKEEICSHKISDTNVYSICQGILSPHSDLLPNGLLHSPPPHLSGLKTLLDDCIAPPAELTRFDVAQEILQFLQNDYSN
ncbi:uncharacterized protein LOC129000803 isoform X2 [Macrosteles quadrilineatus]|nr:uncharacterized protein LOC129000803 isoform X2 [Macrosteles quadrilineatus]